MSTREGLDGSTFSSIEEVREGLAILDEALTVCDRYYTGA